MKPRIEHAYPLVKSIQIILQGARFEAIRFLPVKKFLKDLIGEVEFDLTGENKGSQDDLDFGDLSAIDEIENHFLDPSKYFLK